MRFRTTIILVLLLIGLGAYVYWVEVPKAEQEAKKKTLFDFKTDDVTEMSLIYADHEIVVKKSGDNWRMVKPIDVAADAATDKDVQKIELHADGKDITLAQKDDTWSVESPAAYPADAATMRSFLSSLRSMRAVDFPDPPSDLSAYGFDSPRLRLTLYLGKDNA